jgi:hypothetical protein
MCQLNTGTSLPKFYGNQMRIIIFFTLSFYGAGLLLASGRWRTTWLEWAIAIGWEGRQVPYVLHSLHAPCRLESVAVWLGKSWVVFSAWVHSGVLWSFKTLLPFICKQKYGSECLILFIFYLFLCQQWLYTFFVCSLHGFLLITCE